MAEAIGTIEELAENINSFFVNLSSDFQPSDFQPQISNNELLSRMPTRYAR
jgi:hypothetical protein